MHTDHPSMALPSWMRGCGLCSQNALHWPRETKKVLGKGKKTTEGQVNTPPTMPRQPQRARSNNEKGFCWKGGGNHSSTQSYLGNSPGSLPLNSQGQHSNS